MEMQENQQKIPCTCASDEALPQESARSTVREQELRQDLLRRLNRIEGQIRGIRSMVERDAYCDDILTQVAAASAAMDAVGKRLLESHIRGCFVRRIREGDDDIVTELLSTISKLL